MRGHNASVRDAGSIQQRAKQHRQPDMRQAGRITLDQAHLTPSSKLIARSRCKLHIFQRHPNHLRHPFTTARWRRIRRFGRRIEGSAQPHALISASASAAQQLMPQVAGSSTRRIACTGHACASSANRRTMERSRVMGSSMQTHHAMNGYAKNSRAASPFLPSSGLDGLHEW
jgi:hypothetical protein